ncbi:hypothetical protein PC116_g33955, partial [Phytophthora cactorum]
MASKSRWADTEEDAALEAKKKREKEEKKRLKAEKAQKAEAERRAQAEAEAAAKQRAAQEQQLQQQRLQPPDDNIPPTKRRKITPEQDDQEKDGTTENESSAKLLRFEAGGWGKSRSVENYDKLNDIEEGAYGWVARAKEIKTGKVVALKRLKFDPNDASGLPETGLREIQILKDCSHRNIVSLREVVVGDDTSR